jgi:hypothetical protein
MLKETRKIPGTRKSKQATIARGRGFDTLVLDLPFIRENANTSKPCNYGVPSA